MSCDITFQYGGGHFGIDLKAAHIGIYSLIISEECKRWWCVKTRHCHVSPQCCFLQHARRGEVDTAIFQPSQQHRPLTVDQTWRLDSHAQVSLRLRRFCFVSRNASIPHVVQLPFHIPVLDLQGSANKSSLSSDVDLGVTDRPHTITWTGNPSATVLLGPHLVNALHPSLLLLLGLRPLISGIRFRSGAWCLWTVILCWRRAWLYRYTIHRQPAATGHNDVFWVISVPYSCNLSNGFSIAHSFSFPVSYSSYTWICFRNYGPQ